MLLIWAGAYSGAEQQKENAGDGGGRAHPPRYYLKRKGRILLFDTVEEVEAYVKAERLALETIQKASRRARKRARERFVAEVAPTPSQTLEASLVERVESLFQLPPFMPDQEGYLSGIHMMRVIQLAEQIQQEEDEAITLLLLAA
jgi:hypothetical protein